LVNPDDFDAWRIEGIAHRSEDVVEGARIFDSLQDALSDVTYVVGTTARPRTAQRNYGRPRELAPIMADRAREGTVAILFGREDRGLGNEALDLCHAVAIIPTAPDYSSLNLAQAVLVLAYEIFLAASQEPEPLPRGRRSTRVATVGEMEQTYRALEMALDRIQFFKARKPEAILRIIRTVLGRAEPDNQEAGIFRAMGFEVVAYLNRLEEEGENEAGTPEG
jgi:TrmH family RNA methyltransferase